MLLTHQLGVFCQRCVREQAGLTTRPTVSKQMMRRCCIALQLAVMRLVSVVEAGGSNGVIICAEPLPALIRFSAWKPNDFVLHVHGCAVSANLERIIMLVTANQWGKRYTAISSTAHSQRYFPKLVLALNGHPCGTAKQRTANFLRFECDLRGAPVGISDAAAVAAAAAAAGDNTSAYKHKPGSGVVALHVRWGKSDASSSAGTLPLPLFCHFSFFPHQL